MLEWHELEHSVMFSACDRDLRSTVNVVGEGGNTLSWSLLASDEKEKRLFLNSECAEPVS